MTSPHPSNPDPPPFTLTQRVHTHNDPRRTGTVRYIGPVTGYSGIWVGVDWDNEEGGKHDGSLNGVKYFKARGEKSGSFVRGGSLSGGVRFVDALELRYRGESTQEEEDEMYVYSARMKKVNVQFVGKDKVRDKLNRFEDLVSVSLFYSGVSSMGDSQQIGSIIPNLKDLDLTGNLLSKWEDVGVICKELVNLRVLNLTNNYMAQEIPQLPSLQNIRVLVLNNCGLTWAQVDLLEQSLPAIEELHLMGNKLTTIMSASSDYVRGFKLLRILNLEDNCIASWDEIVGLSQLRSLEQLHLNKNDLRSLFYPDYDVNNNSANSELQEKLCKPFENLRCLYLGRNIITDVASIDALNSFPQLTDIRLSENLVADPVNGGIGRFALVARLAKAEILNGSEVSPRERKESEIRYIRFVMSQDRQDDSHPRFSELKKLHGIEDEKISYRAAGPQKMSAGLLSITMKCVGPSIREKPILTKKLPATTTVGKLKILCVSLFKLKSIKPKLLLGEEGSPLTLLLEDEMSSLMDLGVGKEATILIDEE